MIHLKRARQNLGLIFPRQLLRIFEGQRKPRLLKISARKSLQHFYHSKIILRGMQPRPRQHIPPGLRVAILRLVHVPQHHQVHSIHLLHCSCLNSSRVLHSPFATCAYWTVTLSAKFFGTRSSDSSFSPLSSSSLSWCASWSCSCATPAPVRKSSSCFFASFRLSSLSPFPWQCLLAYCSDLAACPPTAKSSLSPPSASAGAASCFP